MKCKVCNSELPDDALFCPECGNKCDRDVVDEKDIRHIISNSESGRILAYSKTGQKSTVLKESPVSSINTSPETGNNKNEISKSAPNENSKSNHHFLYFIIIVIIILLCISATVFIIYPILTNQAYIYASSTPSNADIYLNDNYIGKTPLLFLCTGNNKISLKIQKSGYYDKLFIINPRLGIISVANGELEKDISEYGKIVNPPIYYNSHVGYLDISSTPSNARVTIGGEFKGNTPLSLSLSPGKYAVYIESPGYQMWYRSVNVYESQKTTVSALLTKYF